MLLIKPSAFTLCLAALALMADAQALPYCGAETPSASAVEEISSTPAAFQRQTIIVPVVVHIVWRREEENLGDDVIFQQIEWLNRDFNGQNEDIIKVHSRFRKSVGNPGIQFCLADRDPFGNASDGITRTFTNVASIGSTSSSDGRRTIKHSSLGGTDAWDVRNYINIWVGDRNDVIGDSTFPSEEDLPNDEDGIVIKYSAFGDHAGSESVFSRGRTLTHEMGHYFNLLHLFGDETGCGTDGDFVDDTPEQSGPYFSCPDDTDPVSCGSLDMEANFMNFRDDACMHYFTKGQSLRMLQTLFTHRYDLLTSGICENQTVLPPDPLSVASVRTLDHDILLTTRALGGYEYSLSLIDALGRLILEIESNPIHSYQLDGGSPGIYFITLRLKGPDRSGELYVRKIFIP